MALFFSHRYITDRRLPDKAIDLIDEAASMIRIQLGSRPLPIDNKERELAGLIVKKEALKRENTVSARNEIEKLEGQIAKIKEDLAILRNQWELEEKLLKPLKRKKISLRSIGFKRKRRSEKSIITESPSCAIALFPQSRKN